MIRGGLVPQILFPKTDSNNLQASISFPDGTPAYETEMATNQLRDALQTVSDSVAKERVRKRLAFPLRNCTEPRLDPGRDRSE